MIARAVAVLLLAGSGATPAGTYWVCGLSEDLLRLVCIADNSGPAEPVRAAAVAMVNGTVFPLDPRLLYEVDLWAPPVEPESVVLLALATLCYRSLDCDVHVHLPRELAVPAKSPRQDASGSRTTPVL